MKIHNVEQGSEAWHKLRLGIPTASEFSRIITPDGKPSPRAKEYAARLVAEIILGRSMDADKSHIEAIARGKELEPFAALAYEFEMGLITQKVGFVTNDAGTIGISPDRFVGNDGLVEIKCPYPTKHVLYSTCGFEKHYIAQVQGQLLLAEREWNDRVSYSDELPIFIDRTYRDEPFIKALDQALKDFHEMKMEMLHKVRAAVNVEVAA
ncbi:YqaJ viral recombinase family protein [Acetobacter sp. TBRC 12305]|uniref:YqaJ viral recombinase family protein n=1 Tax=Acetobacter garciniae TaxID=2817435 RepID=A0A939HP14_9PROT|nr:lambda exonuclease family protein [Acetobacter garciniae]MBO1325379.1 YqaJ viral recombinase family protein [Acetobacter garciniae]MBX0345449.1 YqaJ viral recombinase family protein [Acetobacter garciniae]